MAFALSVAAVNVVIDSVADNGFANGDDYVNNAVPSTTHVPAIARWPKVTAPGGGAGHVFEGIEAAIAIYTRTDVNIATRAGIAAEDKMDIEVGVIVAICRAAFARLYNLDPASVSAAESVIRVDGTDALVVHAEHQDAVAEAMAKWAEPAARYLGLAFYNSISVETSSHNHLPAKTKKLWTTTRELLRLKPFLDATARSETYIAHDMFHPLSDTVKSHLARSNRSKNVLVNLKLGNLAKRIPVKAPDTGVALNYAALSAKAFGYTHTDEELPVDLRAPVALVDAVAEYVDAVDANAAAAAVTVLQAHSVALEEASAYLAGYILGRDARASDNQDLTLDEAKVTNTILGSPAYKRAAGAFPGTFAEAKTRGWTLLSRDAQRAASDGLAPRIAGEVASLGAGGDVAADATARAVAAREAHRVEMAAAADARV
jgi:hypothetical protein